MKLMLPDVCLATNYPDLCQIYDIGTTINGRKILFAKISDNVSLHEAEPEVQYSAIFMEMRPVAI